MSTAEARQAGELLVFLDQRLCLSSDFLSGNFDLDFPFGIARGFCGAHMYLFAIGRIPANPSLADLSVKREGRSVNDPKVLNPLELDHQCVWPETSTEN